MKIIIASSKSQYKGDISSNYLYQPVNFFNSASPNSLIKKYYQGSISDTLAPAYLRYTGIIMKSFLSHSLDPAIIRLAEKLVLFSSPYYGVINFSQPISEYKINYNDKIEGKSIHSLWKNHFLGFSPNEVIIDLSTKQQATYFQSKNTFRYELDYSYIKSAHQGKVFKGEFLSALLIEILNNGAISEKFTEKFRKKIMVKTSY
jgi:hypothetical protein